jgi:selenocysteine-specific elongation factor
MQVIGTAGHVDHGKSSLVHRLTGIDPDRFAEEKRRGLTIDLGFAWLELPSGREIGIVDVPGHERFIKNMLAGAGGISICLFVVAANEGWMPQSAEHLSVLNVLGVRHGVVALAKSDLVDEDTLELAEEEVREHLRPSTLAGAPVVGCSVVTGQGLDDLTAALDAVVGEAPPAPDLGRPRLWVDRVFTIAGSGTVVTGTLAGGSFEGGDEVEIVGPGASGRVRRGRIRGIQSHKKQVSSIAPGNRTALNIVGLERAAAERGDAVVKPGSVAPTSRIDALIEVLDEPVAGHSYELTEKGAHLLYAGSAETPVVIKLLEDESVGPGSSEFAQLYLRDPLPLARGDRFVLRDAGRILTFGGGRVLDPLPPAARRGHSKHLDLLRELNDVDDAGAVAAIVNADGQIDARAALTRAGSQAVPPDVRKLGALLVSDDRYKELTENARAVLADFHARRPLEPGMPREQLRTALDLDASSFDALLDGVDNVAASGAVVLLASHSIDLSPDQQRARTQLFKTLESAGFTPPLAKELHADPALISSLLQTGDLVKIGDFYLSATQAREARARVRGAIEQSGPLTVADIRDLLGTSRKYAVPLCEWLDQTGATLRRGDTRILGPNP